MSITLSPKQIEAKDQIMAFVEDEERQVFTLAGYAGAGKTSLAKEIAKEIGEEQVTFCAFTGKAVNVLREKGCQNVTTIHSAIYKAADHDKKKYDDMQLELVEAREQGDVVRFSRLSSELQLLSKEYMKPKFVLGDGKAFKQDKLTIVDEYSMLNKKLVGDILAAGKKILFMGDPFQLPPVEGECPLIPDMFIEEIHRQALDSAIIRFSKDVREGRQIPYGRHGDLDYVQQSYLGAEDYLQTDQIICGRNLTRANINKWYREQLGFSIYNLPVAGDKMICLKNNKQAALFNGMIGNVIEDAYKQRETDIKYHMQFEGTMGECAVWEGDILGKSEDYNWHNFAMKSLNRFDYAYAITCHKSQGSEFKNVLVINEPVGKDPVMMARWLYTAITRGKEKVTLAA